ncbi:substrate-binding domain-containing protein [Caballeronia sp. NK8]|uniref:substrate-binding domain-containing protein n=1 Tax=Caballeronia sp. NK8 TaxID=140098 RepID=UPI001CECD331|nr:substrate-binding domain-containing protein [Caballeronia sp. NK8]
MLAAAELHGFSPDPAARRLRRQSADTIAFVVSPPQTSFAHPFFLDMLMGVNDTMDNTGYQVIVAAARSVETELDVFRRLIERQRVDALLFGRTRRQDERIAYLLERDIPFVAFGRSETSGTFPFVDIDHQVVGRAGCARFIALGALRGIAETGKMPGRDVGVIGGDNHPIGRYVHPALTTFSAETHRAGKRMAEMLLQRLIRASDGPPRAPAHKESASARSQAVRASRLNCSAKADAFAPSHAPKHVEAPEPLTKADRSHQ